MKGEKDGAEARRTTPKKQVEVLRTNAERLERQIDNLRRNAPERAGEVHRERGKIERLEAENERIRENKSLKDRIREIFKKHGFTEVAVITAVSVVIGAIISNLKKGLTTFGKGWVMIRRILVKRLVKSYLVW